MSTNEGSTSADVTSADSSPAILSASLSLEEKDQAKTAAVGDNDATEIPDLGYPQGWKLWLVYIATLLTMFLVGFSCTPISKTFS
jgi:hypothetical protein